MSICKNCGGKIEFITQHGRAVPLHSCGKSASSKDRLREQFIQRRSVTFATNCPVCCKPVFFYQNSSGSRVFFNRLGWPWPKHPCTSGNLQKNSFVPSSISEIGPVFSRDGTEYWPFKVDRFTGSKNGCYEILMRHRLTAVILRASIKKSEFPSTIFPYEILDADQIFVQGDFSRTSRLVLSYISPSTLEILFLNAVKK